MQAGMRDHGRRDSFLARDRCWIDDPWRVLIRSVFVSTDTQMSIRMINRGDVFEVLEIERKSFNHPMTRVEFLDMITSKNFSCVVYEVNQNVVAYMIFATVRSDHLITGIAVAPEYRFQGIASEMIQHLKFAMRVNKSQIVVSMYQSNVPAMKLFHKNKFGLVDKRSLGSETVLRLRYQKANA